MKDRMRSNKELEIKFQNHHLKKRTITMPVQSPALLRSIGKSIPQMSSFSYMLGLLLFKALEQLPPSLWSMVSEPTIHSLYPVSETVSAV